MRPVTIELPADLEEQARTAGLLTSEALEAMLRERLRRDAIRELVRRADEVFADAGPRMTMDQIQDEVNAVRAKRRRRAARS